MQNSSNATEENSATLVTSGTIRVSLQIWSLPKRWTTSSEQKNSNVIAVACHPGVCATDMFVHIGTTMRGEPPLLDSVPTAEDGSMAQLKCICESGITSGDLWGPDFKRPGEVVHNDISPPLILVDENVKTTLWELCEKATGVFEL
mmetsp:Transcript_56838/g.64419  ORF Transcript_56838/g.64419 Transcript_56838/m.64419 type:complete len:146 (+) Transcript_56838:730-1167(+)